MTYSLKDQEYDIGLILAGVSLISWERSSAHFNIGITVANVFVDLNYFSLIFMKTFLILVVQFLAATAAMGLCRYMVQVDVMTKLDNKEIIIQPHEPTIRPES